MKIELSVEEFEQIFGARKIRLEEPELKVSPYLGGIHKVDTKTTTYTGEFDSDDKPKYAGRYLNF